MFWLIVGLALWWGGHLFKRVAPEMRARMSDKMGEASKAPIALVLLGSVVLMVIGYRAAEFTPVYDPPAWARHLNNLLMLASVALFGAANSKSRLRAKLRHPMLIGFATWAVAHLLVNGDLASVVLFGVLLVWALVEIPLINSKAHDYVPYEGGTAVGDVRLAVITVVVYGVIAAIHTWLGYWPFPG